jgi:glycosyltransferase involved in cell wall biosynthesis
MRLLFCCELYHPSQGGVQEVMRQIAERMVRLGHDVTVATTQLPQRTFDSLNGVRIAEFAVTGNAVRGMTGEVERYRAFVRDFAADAILVKAAQQWTFDALWPALDDIRARKVFIPCGYSGFFEPAYAGYFAAMPGVLRKFDHLIFYATHYRDIDFARANDLSHWSIIPNGASEIEFADPPRASARAALRDRLAIPQDAFVFLTVGSLTGQKGHRELAEAYARLETAGRNTALVINGNVPAAPATLPVGGAAARAAQLMRRSLALARREGLAGVARRIGVLWVTPAASLERSIDAASADQGKRVLRTNLARADLVALYKAADLFVFASNVEYSPLVLFEAAAAGLPFLSVPVGNAEEIADWTGGGIICPAPVDERGYTRVDPARLAEAMQAAMAAPERLKALGAEGRRHWLDRFNWARIAKDYEAVLMGGMSKDGRLAP